MPKAAFTVDVAAEQELSDDGADDVTFLLAPNPGEPARPLARAASGGELSRAMLALRVVLSEAPPTLVFDEVDAGIGGEAGSAVGRALAGLGGHHQVFCVTHLPQVAAFADAHVAVVKARAAGPDARQRGDPPRRRPRRRARPHARGRPRLRPCPCARPASCVERAAADSLGSARAMRLRRASTPATRPVGGVARVDRRTKDLAKRIGRGEIAIIDHRDIDRVAGESLVAAGVGAVVNAERVDLRSLPERRTDPHRRGRHPDPRRGRRPT